MAHMVHGNIIGCPGSAVFAVDGEACGKGVSGQVVENRKGRGRAGYFGINRHPESPGHGHGLDHLGHGFFDGILGLMGRRAGQADADRNPPDGGDEPVDLVPHEQSAVAGFGALAVFDFNGARDLPSFPEWRE